MRLFPTLVCKMDTTGSCGADQTDVWTRDRFHRFHEGADDSLLRYFALEYHDGDDETLLCQAWHGGPWSPKLPPNKWPEFHEDLLSQSSLGFHACGISSPPDTGQTGMSCLYFIHSYIYIYTLVVPLIQYWIYSLGSHVGSPHGTGSGGGCCLCSAGAVWV